MSNPEAEGKARERSVPAFTGNTGSWRAIAAYIQERAQAALGLVPETHRHSTTRFYNALVFFSQHEKLMAGCTPELKVRMLYSLVSCVLAEVRAFQSHNITIGQITNVLWAVDIEHQLKACRAPLRGFVSTLTVLSED